MAFSVGLPGKPSNSQILECFDHLICAWPGEKILLVRILAGALICGAALWVWNSSMLVTQYAVRPKLLSHRGVHQPFDQSGIDNDTCTAERIFERSMTISRTPFRRCWLHSNTMRMLLNWTCTLRPTTSSRFFTIGRWIAVQTGRVSPETPKCPA